MTEAYCLKCKKRVTIKAVEKHGNVHKGRCDLCNAKVSTFVKKEGCGCK